MILIVPMTFLFQEFDGNILFELPPLSINFTMIMQGMDRKHNGRPWCVMKISNIKNDYALTFTQATYAGHLHCWLKIA